MFSPNNGSIFVSNEVLTKNQIMISDHAAAIRQEANSFHICPRALNIWLAVPEEISLTTKTGRGSRLNVMVVDSDMTGKVTYIYPSSMIASWIAFSRWLYRVEEAICETANKVFPILRTFWQDAGKLKLCVPVKSYAIAQVFRYAEEFSV